MQDTGVLTASVKTAIDGLVKEGFIIATSERYFQKYSKKIIHYKLELDTAPYLKKADLKPVNIIWLTLSLKPFVLLG